MRLDVVATALTGGGALCVVLRHPRKPELPAWTAGAHVDLHLGDGRMRQYSLCGDPADRSTYRIAVKREPHGRGGSAWVHAELLAGTQVLVSAPRNNFPLAEGAARHVLIAGGIGITPLLAMARALAADGADFTLHYCAASDDAPLLDDVRAVCGDRLVTWFRSDARRFDLAQLGPAAPGTHLYVCGPQRLLDAVRRGARRLGWPDSGLHMEVFQPVLDEDFTPEPFDVRLVSSDAVLHVPADRSLLDVLREHGVPMPSSCELGICGACECGYSDGSVIHRDQVLPLATRQDRMTPCVSRARVSITLDL